MTAELVVTLMRTAWLTLAGMMICSRIVFQVAGAPRMRSFLNTWKESTTKRVWGLAACAYGIVVCASAVPVLVELAVVDVLLLGLLIVVLVGDGLLNVLPGSFGKFKEEMQNRWVRRQRDPARQGDRALFGTVNLLLGTAALAVAAVVTLYRPMDAGLVAASLAASALLTTVLVVGALSERGRATRNAPVCRANGLR